LTTSLMFIFILLS